MKITLNKKTIDVPLRRLSLFGKIKGLMFSRSSQILFFANTNRIHSLFVFFSFLAVWLNDKNEIIEITMVKPFRLDVKPRKFATNLIEIPIVEDNNKIIELLVGKGKV